MYNSILFLLTFLSIRPPLVYQGARLVHVEVLATDYE